MAIDVTSLPRDPDALIQIIADLGNENDKLRAMLDTVRRTLFGTRSERFETDTVQLTLGIEEGPATPVDFDASTVSPLRRDRSGRSRPERNIGGLPAHLPREEVVIEPVIDACPHCCGRLHRIGEDVSEMLDIVPAIIRVKRIRRPRYGCRVCESAVVQAAAPPRPVERGLPTTALLAHVAAAKFAWHLPLNRQAQMLAGHGITLDRSTLVHWIGRIAWWLQPLHTLLLETVLSAPKVFCDDTPLPVLDRTRRRTRIGRLWCYAVDDRPWQGPAPTAVVYLYAEDRRGRHVEEHPQFHGVCRSTATPDTTTGEARPAWRSDHTAYCLATHAGSSSRCTSRPPIRCRGSAAPDQRGLRCGSSTGPRSCGTCRHPAS